MSERTPQDVLRELRTIIGNWSFSEYCASRDVILGLIDKAIAEAPDSPQEAKVNDLTEAAWGVIANAGGGNWALETAEWQEAAARWRERYHAALKAPDSPPQLDVERLAAAFRAANLEGIPYSRLSSVPEDYELHSREVAKLIAAEYNRLGSTDSEGR